MLSFILTKAFLIGLAVVSFFVNIAAEKEAKKAVPPPDAIRVEYGDEVCERYDMFLPENVGEHADVLFVIHGGSWVMGNGTEYSNYCRAAANEGFVAVTTDYQKIQNGATAYKMVDEIGKAIASVKTELEDRDITPDNIILAGHSAGSHLSLMYAYTHYNDCPINLAFVVSNCAPTEFYKDAEDKTTKMGELAHFALTGLTGHYIFEELPEKQKDIINSVSPLYMVTPDVPPTIIAQGTNDNMVPFSNSADLYKALADAGVDTKYIVYEGAPHMLGYEYEKENKERTEAFYEFYEKYCK